MENLRIKLVLYGPQNLRINLALGANICFIYGANVAKKAGVWVPSVETEPKTIAVRRMRWSSAGGPRLLQNTGLAGGKRTPELDCSGGPVSGGRPKAAFNHAVLRRAVEGRPCLQLVDFRACI